MATSNPFEMMEQVFDRMSRQFDEMSHSWETGEAGELWSLGPHKMAIDVAERDDEYEITVDVPGFDREDIEVRVTDHTLHIDAAREEEELEEDEHYLKQERHRASLHRSVQLPGEIDVEEVEATAKNGILTITVPRAEPLEESKTIEIS